MNDTWFSASFFSHGSIVGLDNTITDLFQEMVTRKAKNMIIRPNTPTSFLIGRGNIHHNSTLISAEEMKEDMAALGIDISKDDSFHMLYKSDSLPKIYRFQFVVANYGSNASVSITVRNVQEFDANDLPEGITL